DDRRVRVLAEDPLDDPPLGLAVALGDGVVEPLLLVVADPPGERLEIATGVPGGTDRDREEVAGEGVGFPIGRHAGSLAGRGLVARGRRRRPRVYGTARRDGPRLSVECRRDGPSAHALSHRSTTVDLQSRGRLLHCDTTLSKR